VAGVDSPGYERVRALADAAAAVDGVSPVDEQVLLRLKHGDDVGVVHLTRWDAGQLVGYGHLDQTGSRSSEAIAKLVVDPAHRRRGIGRALVQEMIAAASPAALSLWSHGRHPAAVALADSLGFTVVRELWKLRRGLGPDLPQPPALPDDVHISTFMAGDEQAVVDVNAAAFAHHPEQGQMTLVGLKQRMAEPWFDPQGMFLAWRDQQLLGFHWTKVHTSDTATPFGEVYVVGIAPAAQGIGLGTTLTLVGLHDLRSRALGEARLYVEGDNAAAISVYQRLGFEHVGTDALYRRAPDR
jgi:mycothiol synthase